MVRRMVVVIMIVAGNWLFAGRIAAQDEGCLTTVNYLIQAQEQSVAAAYADALDSYACAMETDPSNAAALCWPNCTSVRKSAPSDPV